MSHLCARVNWAGWVSKQSQMEGLCQPNPVICSSSSYRPHFNIHSEGLLSYSLSFLYTTFNKSLALLNPPSKRTWIHITVNCFWLHTANGATGEGWEGGAQKEARFGFSPFATWSIGVAAALPLWYQLLPMAILSKDLRSCPTFS